MDILYLLIPFSFFLVFFILVVLLFSIYRVPFEYLSAYGELILKNA